MCRWRRWIIPGAVAVVALTALALLLRAGGIEGDLTQRTVETLARDGLPWASASLDGRNVTLQGTAPSETDRDLAIASANRVWGNHRVDAGSISLLPLADPYQISINVSEGAVTLSGTLPGAEAQTRLLDAVRTVAGNREIVDQTTLARGAPAELGSYLGFLTDRLDGLATAEAVLNGTELSLRGLAASQESYNTEIAALSGDLPDGMTLGETEILPPLMRPYLWSATRGDDGRVVLEGNVPTETARQDVLAAAATLAGGMDRVEDRMMLASGAPDGFAGSAAFAIGQLAGLLDGTASLEDSELSVVGRARDRASFDAVTSALTRGLPAGVTLALQDIRPAVESPYTFTARREGTALTLTGFVPDDDARAALTAAAGGVAGVENIIDELRVADGAPEGFQTLATQALGRLAGLDPGEAALSDLAFSLTGTAMTPEDYAARSDAGAVVPQGLDLATLQIAPPAIDPYVTEAMREGEGVILRGFVPSEEARAALVAAAEVMGPVRDELQLATGAPDIHADTTQAAMAVIAGLEGGRFSLSNETLTIEGQAGDDAAYEAATAFVDENPVGVAVISATILPPLADPFVLTINREGQAVTVSGHMPSELARALLLETLTGEAFVVTDESRLASGAAEGITFDALGPLVLALAGKADPFSIVIDGATATVRGMALEQGSRTETEALATDALTEIGFDAADVVITEGVPSPYTLEASARGEAVRLGGYVPDQETADSILTFARDRFSRGVSDELTIAEGAPQGFSGLVEAGLQALSRLSSGELTLSDTDMTLAGEAFLPGNIPSINEGLGAAGGLGSITADLSVADAGPQRSATECDLYFAQLLAGNAIRFQSGSAAIEATSYGLLDRLAHTVLTCGGAQVEVSGHTDATGGDAANQRLSEARAQAVVDYLVSAGIPADRLAARL